MAAEVLFEARGTLGVIRLNRPGAMNALNLNMVRQMLHQLQEWRDDPGVSQVLVLGAGDRGLCAGGDVRSIYEDIRATRASGRDYYTTTEFFATEFRLNHLISQYPKPYIAFMDGATLGGGIGISAHGRHRVVTERTRAGMPETTIGYFPDVGGTHLLARSPGRAGLHAGLTAGIFGAADTIHLGLADVYVPSGKLAALAEALEQETFDQVKAGFTETPPVAPLRSAQDWIDDAYSAETAEEILERLAAWGATHPDAARAREDILSRSPTALKLTLHGIREASRLELSAALVREYAAGQHQLRGHDFAEGIRAQVIDRDRSPRWDPATLPEVDEMRIEEHFLPGPHPTFELFSPIQEAHS
ncbi:enoyl-CoA hydratase/isomerase family protein [Nesterenkonia sp. LB17]|uniref:enoyl-CoA hydratase/isomerase family protein n=1 Tax=Nesterenkonia sp. LB17 TaxID=2901230 RepID=UPI001F4CC225|nr:enoyl-CoA hydratase/isomerase family protein [Nesterenkonia sp. LB17]MCH8566006.1 enoyl-CoA hydratase/isomerase family protein [Nesterenkonia sp. LB17]